MTKPIKTQNPKWVQLEFDFKEEIEEEEYKDIKNYEGLYQVTSYGRVYSLISKKFLKPQKEKEGYLRVNLYKNNKMKHYPIHRLVAQAFILNPSKLPQINHISEDKTDNRVSNLEYCTAKYNVNYGTRTKRAVAKRLQNPNWMASIRKHLKAIHEKKSKAVLQLTKEGIFVAEYPSAIEAEKQTRIDKSSIGKCCRGDKNHSHAGNFLWKYKEIS